MSQQTGQKSDQYGRYPSLGLALGLVLGGLTGIVFGALFDDFNQSMILGAGGGMILGLAVGLALERRQQNRT